MNTELYRIITKLIETGQTAGLSNKVDVLFAAGKITEAEFNELSEKIPEETPNEYGISEELLQTIENDTFSRFQHEISGTDTAALPETELVSVMRAMTLTADDQTAARAVNLYPAWAVGLQVTEGERLQHEGKLYKCLKSHETQENWKPSQDTASIWEVIDIEHAGTEEDPIPYSVNMTVYEGKYYTFNGVRYKCIRDSEQPLQHTPDQLIDIYFVVS